MQLWRAFLSSSDNKSSFIKFLASQWTDSLHREKLNEKILYVTCEEECHKVTKDGVPHKKRQTHGFFCMHTMHPDLGANQ